MKAEVSSLTPIGFEYGGINEYGYERVAFRGCDFKKLIGPGVYLAATKSDGVWKYLYIGSAKNLLARISDEEHESLRKAMEFEGVALYLVFCKSEANARFLENDLISFFQPELNISGKSMNSPLQKALAEAEATA